MADYPDLYPFVKVSVQKSFLKERYLHSHPTRRTEPCFTGSALSEPYPRTGGQMKDNAFTGRACETKEDRELH